MSLRLQALERRLAEAAAAVHYEGAKVLSKVNARGELVVAVILPAQYACEADNSPPPRKRY